MLKGQSLENGNYFGYEKNRIICVQRRLGRGLPLYQVASRAIQPFGHNTLGPKIGRLPSPFSFSGDGYPSNTIGVLCPFFDGAAGSPSNTMSRGQMPVTTPSDILIHPFVWSQQTWADNGGSAPFVEGSWVLI